MHKRPDDTLNLQRRNLVGGQFNRRIASEHGCHDLYLLIVLGDFLDNSDKIFQESGDYFYTVSDLKVEFNEFLFLKLADWPPPQLR